MQAVFLIRLRLLLALIKLIHAGRVRVSYNYTWAPALCLCVNILCIHQSAQIMHKAAVSSGWSYPGTFSLVFKRDMKPFYETSACEQEHKTYTRGSSSLTLGAHTHVEGSGRLKKNRREMLTKCERNWSVLTWQSPNHTPPRLRPKHKTFVCFLMFPLSLSVHHLLPFLSAVLFSCFPSLFLLCNLLRFCHQILSSV